MSKNVKKVTLNRVRHAFVVWLSTQLFCDFCLFRLDEDWQCDWLKKSITDIYKFLKERKKKKNKMC